MKGDIKSTRLGNIEIVRVLSMMMIVLWHLYCHFLVKSPTNHEVTSTMFIVSIYLPMHVDLFVLITGFFGIRHFLRKIFDTYLLMLYYLLLIALLFWTFDWKLLLFPLSHSPWWFMRTYIYLLLLAPLLNFVCDNMPRTTGWKSVLIPLLILNEYFGFAWHDLYLAHFGFDLLNFVTIYVIGRYIASEDFEALCHRLPFGTLSPWKFWLYCFLLVQVLRAVCYYTIGGLGINTHNWDYNHPLNIASAVSFFQIFRNVRLTGKWIYFLSSSAVAVYLVTEHPYVLPKIENMFFRGYNQIADYSTLGGLAYCFLFTVLTYVVVSVVDKVRIPFLSFVKTKITSHVRR